MIDVQLNAVDPSGEDVPDEMFHRPGNGHNTELVREDGGWQVRLYHGEERVGVIGHEDFADAFAEFASYAYDVEQKAEGVA